MTDLRRGRTVLRRPAVALIALMTASVLAPAAETHASAFPVTNVAGLVAAINSTNASGGTNIIYVEPGTYSLTTALPAINPSSTANLTICGSLNGAACDASPSSVILDGTGANIVFLVAPVPNLTVTFQNLTIRNGKASDGTGGGGIQAGNFNQSIVVTSCIFTHNSVTSGNGGAIEYAGDGGTGENLSVTNSTFDGNSVSDPNASGAVSPGGAIDDVGGSSLTVSGSTFHNNIAGGSGFAPGQGGAISFGNSILGATAGITTSTFDGNTSSSVGGAVWNHGGHMTIRYNRFVNNSAPAGGNVLYQQSDVTGSITGDSNWWGTNTGPAAGDVGESAGATVPTSAPYLQLRASASPGKILVNGTATITADIYSLSGGGSVPNCPGATCPLNGLPSFSNAAGTVFGNAQKGSIPAVPPNITFSSGRAQVTFTAGGTGGNGSVDAIADGQTVTAPIEIDQPPAITSGNSATFTVGSAGTFTVTATGFPASTFSESGPLPSGVTLNTATGALSGTPATGSAGTYPLTITASNGISPNATQSFTLTVLDIVTIQAGAGWNMVGGSPLTLWSDSLLNWSWNAATGTWSHPTGTEPAGTGTWEEVSAAGPRTVTTQACPSPVTVPVVAHRWNMVGNPCNRSVSLPSTAQALWWNPTTKAYVPVTSINPGAAAWVKPASSALTMQ